MNKIVMIRTVALLMLTAIPLIASAQRGSVSYTATYDRGKLTIGATARDGVTYSTVEYDGLFNDAEPGALSLPVDYIRFSVPSNAGNFTVTATASATNSVELDYPVYICPLETDDAMHHDDSERPALTAWYVDEGMLAGENHIVTVAIAPVTSGTGNVLLMNGSVSVTLNYELCASPQLTPIIRRGAALRAKGQEDAQGMVVNPGDVVGNAASTRMGINRDDELADPETYLIVTTDSQVHPLRRLAALKRQKGIPVKVVTMDEVVNDPVASQGDIFEWGGDTYITFTDDAGKLRRYLKTQYYDYGTEYVLLAGTDVPTRYRSGGCADMYFSDLTASWTDHIDKHGELYVGRLLGSDEQQFVNYVDKLLKYELNPGNGDYSYLGRALFLASEEHAIECQNVMPEILSACPDTLSIIENANTGYYPTGNAVLDSIRTNQYGFMLSYNNGTPTHLELSGPDLAGHSYYLWALSNEKDGLDDLFGITDIETGNGLDCMDNEDFPMICFSAAGITITYGVEINLGESFTTGKGYGGPVYMGLTGCTDPFFEVDMELFADEVCGYATLNTPLGRGYCNSKASANSLYWENLVCMHNYLGDPILYMWKDMPQTYSGISLSRSNNSVTITGVPTSTTVAYYSNDGTIGTVTASSSTVMLNGVSPNSNIMLYQRNNIPYIAPLILQNVTINKSQYVIADSVLAGHAVDNSRTTGQVIVKNGADYEIEASGEVKIAGGFKVEKGGYFAITPASYK